MAPKTRCFRNLIKELDEFNILLFSKMICMYTAINELK